MKKSIVLIIAIFMINVAEAQWQQVSVLQPNCFATIDNYVYAGTSSDNNQGILVSVDNGNNFSPVTSPSNVFALFVIDPFVGPQGCNFYVGADDGAYYWWSDDYFVDHLGAPDSYNYNHKTVSLVAKSPFITNAYDSVIVVLDDFGKLFLSTDFGQGWWSVNDSIINKVHVKTLAISGNNIYAASDSGMFLSVNNTYSWVAIDNGLGSDTITSLAVDGNNIFAGAGNGIVYMSSNNGTNWVALGNSFSSPVNTLTAKGDYVFAGTENGVYFMSISNDYSWTAINDGLTYKNITNLAISGANLIAGIENNGIWKIGVFNTITASANPTVGGGILGGGAFIYSQTCTLNANPNNSYTFIYWTENGNIISTATSYTFTVNSSRNLVANFLPDTTHFTIITSTNPIIGGSISGGGVFTVNQLCTVKVASINTNYVFKGWVENGIIVSTDTNYSFIVNTNRNLVAVFLPLYAVITSVNSTISGSSYGGGLYVSGQTCSINAVPFNGYTFVDWTENGSIVSTNTSYTFIVTGNRNLVANFTETLPQYAMTPLANPSIGGTITGGGTFTYNQSCTLNATPYNGYVFLDWTENGNIICLDASYNFIVTTGRYLVANFTSTQGIVSNTLNESIYIYPNPTKDNLTIETNSNTEQRIEIINLIGQTIYTNSINKKATINTSAFAKGVYILKLSSDKETIVKKFIKQ